MIDYEVLILQRQEELEIWEDAPEMFPEYHPEDDIIEEHYSDLYLRYINRKRGYNGL